MLDRYMRPLIDPPLHYCGQKIGSLNISANTITLIGFFLGLIAMGCIVCELYGLAFIFFMSNRLLDGMDGAVSRIKGQTDFGGFLDIVCDFIIYAGIVFAFGIANSDYRTASHFLIFSFIGPITSFLAYAIIAAKKKMTTTVRGHKSFYHLGGICEGTETMMVLGIMCLFPQIFSLLCWIYGVLCWMTTLGRTYCAWVDFKDVDSSHVAILSEGEDVVEKSYKKRAKAIESQVQ